ncbi:MAG: prepilin-type N-terminal cleavage/methylation domain-containing protein [Clostridium sp.]|uniref:PulJ/GspJ family protein n=1 Tax=Clostridium sp. TaxID=1506 RepID=UPI0039E9AE45
MKRKGFTLVEVMITLAIFTIFSLYLYQTFWGEIKQTFRFYNSIDNQTDANKDLNMITDVIRNNNIQKPDKLGYMTQVFSINGSHPIIDYNKNSKVLSLNYKDSEGKYVNTIYNNIEVEINAVQYDDVNEKWEYEGNYDDGKDLMLIIKISINNGDINSTRSTAINITR